MHPLLPPLQRDRFEQSTSLTDLLIAVVAFAGALRISRRSALPTTRRTIWSAALSGLALSALIGALVHGLHWSARSKALIWRLLNLALSLTVGLFAVAALYDTAGRRAALRLLPLTILSACGLEAATHRLQRGFGVLLAYEAAALSSALATYLNLARQRQLRGAGRISLGIALSLIAAAVQRTSWQVDRSWLALDHNGLFHLVQLAGLFPLIDGICEGNTVQQ